MEREITFEQPGSSETSIFTLGYSAKLFYKSNIFEHCWRVRSCLQKARSSVRVLPLRRLRVMITVLPLSRWHWWAFSEKRTFLLNLADTGNAVFNFDCFYRIFLRVFLQSANRIPLCNIFKTLQEKVDSNFKLDVTCIPVQKIEHERNVGDINEYDSVDTGWNSSWCWK